MQDIEQATLELLLQRPLAFPRFEDLCTMDVARSEFKRICSQARAEQLRSEFPLPP